jgi:hypothetical protein
MEELDIAQELLSTVCVPTGVRTVHLLKSSQKLCDLSQLVQSRIIEVPVFSLEVKQCNAGCPHFPVFRVM